MPRRLYVAAALGEPPAPLEALAAAERRATARWLLERLPPAQQLPARVLLRALDDGRGEFTLSRARHNWRRLGAARAWLAGSVGAAFARVCAWDNAWLSGGAAAAVVALGVWPSQVLAALLVALAALLWRNAGAAAGDRPPPMEPDIAAPGDDAAGGGGLGGAGGDGSSAVPGDPYSQLKQQYDAVVAFVTAVQNVLDGWAGALERAQALAAWRDPTASAAVLAALLGYAAALLVFGVRPLVVLGLLWVLRPPVLRDPCPAPPTNFFARLPTRSDTTL